MFLGGIQLQDLKWAAMLQSKIIYYIVNFTSISLTEENQIPGQSHHGSQMYDSPNFLL